jgi:RNA polymerase sigma-70 factor (ECF subfamily)
VGLSENRTVGFEQLYLENHKKVYKLALGLTGNRNDAEEITQEAFYKAFQSYHTFRGESSFFTWIYRITTNVANDYMRQRTKMPVQALTEDFGYSLENIIDDNPANNPETELLSKEARYMCLHCLTECLPRDQRVIFCLAITIGLPYKQVAEILECSLSRVKITVHRAKQRWFDYMENRCSLLKKSNPCHCEQWVRFGLQQGWITKPDQYKPGLEFTIKAGEELRQLKNLRALYKAIYPDNMDALFVARIKEGIKKREWGVIS